MGMKHPVSDDDFQISYSPTSGHQAAPRLRRGCLRVIEVLTLGVILPLCFLAYTVVGLYLVFAAQGRAVEGLFLLAIGLLPAMWWATLVRRRD